MSSSRVVTGVRRSHVQAHSKLEGSWGYSMSIRRLVVTLLAPMYAFAVAVLILVLSGSPYAFMIGETDNSKKMTFCDLPKPTDNPSDVYIPLTGILVFGLLVAGGISSYRARRIRPSLVLGCALTLFWAYRSFLQNIGC